MALFAALIWKEKLRLAFWAGLILVLGMALVITSGMRGSRPTPAICGHRLKYFLRRLLLAAQRGGNGCPSDLYLAGRGSRFAGHFYRRRALGFPCAVSRPSRLIFLITGLVSQIGGYFMVSYALGNLPAAVVAPSMLASPLLSALLAIPFAGEGLSLQAAGGLIALTGIWLINRPRAKEELFRCAQRAIIRPSGGFFEPRWLVKHIARIRSAGVHAPGHLPAQIADDALDGRQRQNPPDSCSVLSA